MHRRKLIPEVKEETEDSNRLQAPVQLGKMYEKTIKESEMLSPFGRDDSAKGSYNEELNWDQKQKLARLERRRKREQEKKQEIFEEYEEYLAQRGISSRQQCVKIHQSRDGRGEENIQCRNIHINMGSTVLLTDTNLVINAKRRYGLVGRNGVGKTTLLRYLAEGELEGVSPYIQMLHIEQEYAGDDRTPLQAVLDTDVERTNLLREEQDMLANGVGDGAGQRLTEIYERMDEIDAHGAEARALTILQGLSFSKELLATPTKKLSGGWKMRVALSRALYIMPDVLLLDEPTNHLDLHAVLWLEHTLITWPKTLVVVSHSRSFLNAVCTDIIHYNQQRLTYYKGNYYQFEQARYELLKNQTKTFEAQQKQKAHMQAFVDRWRYNAKKARMAQSRMKSIERMEFVPAVVEDSSFQFSIPDPEPCPAPFIQVVDVTFGYSRERVLFRDVNIGIDNDSRIALVGANGSGKSTFLNVIAGDFDALEGRVIRNGKCRIARFTQHHVDQLQLQKTGLEVLAQNYPQADPQALRAQLGRFGLTGEKATQPIYTLSGGQKSRVAFALLTMRQPHLLLLDEPTNHLDIDTVDALIDALNCYKGGVVIISHDEHLIESVCDEIWVAGNGELVRYHGEFRDYKRQLIKEMSK
eukprot:TRINITY_DN1604_c0_g1_i1.p1 TRINITY_DN1604_c0_g1~~TRINITY_DN1604_c0_g1_i1.p1  ORF type:complete len:737 (+),score=215.36 TRINITY_DN1604_c0_g1_i1:293-2212(+)